MNALANPLVVNSFKNTNTTAHISSLKTKRYCEHSSSAYCMCGHQPTIIPVKRNGKETFVAMCNDCVQGGSMELKEFKAPYLALQHFNDVSRLTLNGGVGHGM